MRGDWGDVMRIVLSTAPLDESAAESLGEGTSVTVPALRGGDAPVGVQALKSGVTVDEATDLLWFFFGYAGFFTLTEDNGWSPQRAEEWLRDTAAFSL